MINNTGRNDFYFFFANPPPPAPAAQTPYNPIVRWSIDANGLTIQRSVDRNYTRLYKYMYYYEGFAGMDLYFQSYTRFPQANNACGGYLDYTNLNNPVLHAVMGVGGTGTDPDVPANPQQLSMIVNARDYNFWFLKSGIYFLFLFFGHLFPLSSFFSQVTGRGRSIKAFSWQSFSGEKSLMKFRIKLLLLRFFWARKRSYKTRLSNAETSCTNKSFCSLSIPE